MYFILKAWILGLVLLGACLAAAPGDAGADEWNETYSPPRAFTMNTTMPLHVGASNNTDKLGPVDKGATVFVSSMVKGWCHLQTKDGRTGYIFKRYLAPVEKTPEKQTPPPVAKPEPPAESKTEPKIETKPEIRPVGPPREVGVGLKKLSQPHLPGKEPERLEPVKPLVAEPAKKVPEPAPRQQVPSPVQPEIPTRQQSAQSAEDIFKNNTKPEQKTEVRKEPEPKSGAKPDSDDGAPQRQVAAKETRLDSAPPGKETLEEPLGRAAGAKKAIEVAGCSRYMPLHFGKSGVSATAENALPAGGQDCYRFLMLKDRKLDIVLTSTSNAVFDLYTPLSGQIVAGQAQCQLQTRSSGDKIIVIKAGKDNASYKLNLNIR